MFRALCLDWRLCVCVGLTARGERHRELIFGILERQRRRILQENRTHQNLDEAIVRHYLMRIDMEEERLRLPH